MSERTTTALTTLTMARKVRKYLANRSLLSRIVAEDNRKHRIEMLIPAGWTDEQGLNRLRTAFVECGSVGDLKIVNQAISTI